MPSRGVATPRDCRASIVRDDFPTPTQPRRGRVPAPGRSSFRLGISHARATHTREAGTWEHFRVPHDHPNLSSSTYHCTYINVTEISFNVLSFRFRSMRPAISKCHITTSSRATREYVRHVKSRGTQNRFVWKETKGNASAYELTRSIPVPSFERSRL